jgi:phospholipase D1/2
VKKRRHQNPLNKLKRRSSANSSSDSSDAYDSVEEEEIPELPVISQDGHYWIGKDYSNTYKADFKDVADFSRDQFARDETPRMPWRDQALVCFGESARDLARHFIQRWNQCKREKVKAIVSYPFLLPKSYNEPFNNDFKKLFNDQLYKCNVQITRSLDSWSGGLSETESSILKAYRDLIQKAEHYIYIENQFFVTTCDPEKDKEVQNDIGLQLVNRILRAHQNKEKFRVFIVLPLLPGFDSLNAIQAVQYYNLRSINLGDYSIFKCLKQAGIQDPSEYITFHGMRNWSVLMGKLVQEIVYVHSKLMIVDDKYVICGSANINDRSMLGKRDSELAAVVRDEEFQDSVLNGKKVKVGKYAFSLRKKIFRLHLGVYFDNSKKIDVNDCVSDEFYNMFKSTSNQNTRVYDEVFKCLPSDNILNFEILASYRDQNCLVKTDPVKGKAQLKEKVFGFIVDFPLKFLSQEKNFFPEINTPEGIVPTAMWT